MLDRPAKLDLLRRAYTNARDMSDDPSTQNGSVLVPRGGMSGPLVYGANLLPKGSKAKPEDVALWSKKFKYRVMGHAERVAIYRAARDCVPTNDATLVCPWFACTDCAKAIIEAGIVHVIGHQQMRNKLHPTWMEEIEFADKMLDAAGVDREYIDADLFDSDPAHAVLFQGELWIP
ncbi:MAG: hypothetical protein ACYS7Y_11640 [Planctomycetota bacterium]|jgi:dCMP deaminase